MKNILMLVLVAFSAPAFGAQTVYLEGHYRTIEKEYGEGAIKRCLVRYDLEQKSDQVVLKNLMRSGEYEAFMVPLKKKPNFLGLLSPRYAGMSVERMAAEQHLGVFLTGKDLTRPESITFGVGYENGEIQWDTGLFGSSAPCTDLAPISRDAFAKEHLSDGGAPLPEDQSDSAVVDAK